MPAIVSQEIFDKAQTRLAESQKRYRNPKETQLLSHLVRCGDCGTFCSPYQRYYRSYRYFQNKAQLDKYLIRHKVAYRCNRRIQQVMHSKKSDIVRCKNPEIIAHRLELTIFNIIKNQMTDPVKLQKCLEFSKDDKWTSRLQMEKQLKDIEQKLVNLAKEKREVIDKYATGKLSRKEYAEKCQWYDNEIKTVKANRKDSIKLIPILHKKEVVDVSIKRFCESVKSRLEKCTDFDTKRQFFLDYVKQIVYQPNQIILQGFVPIKLKAYEDPDQTSEASKINFLIKGKIISK